MCSIAEAESLEQSSIPTPSDLWRTTPPRTTSLRLYAFPASLGCGPFAVPNIGTSRLASAGSLRFHEASSLIWAAPTPHQDVTVACFRFRSGFRSAHLPEPGLVRPPSVTHPSFQTVPAANYLTGHRAGLRRGMKARPPDRPTPFELSLSSPVFRLRALHRTPHGDTTVRLPQPRSNVERVPFPVVGYRSTTLHDSPGGVFPLDRCAARRTFRTLTRAATSYRPLRGLYDRPSPPRACPDPRREATPGGSPRREPGGPGPQPT